VVNLVFRKIFIAESNSEKIFENQSTFSKSCPKLDWQFWLPVYFI